MNYFSFYLLFILRKKRFSYLFYVADNGCDFETLELCIDGVESAYQVLEEKLECLREAEHGATGDHEGGHLLAAVVDDFALVGGGVVGGNGGRGRGVAEGAVHELVHGRGEVQVTGGEASAGANSAGVAGGGQGGGAGGGHEERGRVAGAQP